MNKLCYSLFDTTILSTDVHVTNAKNGHVKESLVSLYGALHGATSESWYLSNALDLPQEDIFKFYSVLVRDWITDSYNPPQSDLDALEKDLLLIIDTFRMSNYNSTPRDSNLLDWNEEKYTSELSKLKQQLHFYNN